MNNVRRKDIKAVVERIYKMQEMLEDIKSDLECIKDEEDEYRDNIPENLQESDRYYASEEASDQLDDAISEIDSALSEIEEAIYSAETAME